MQYLLATLIVLFLWMLPAAAQIQSGPWLQGVTNTSAVIMWESSSSSPGEVNYGTSPSFGQEQGAQTVTTVPARPGVTDNQAIIQEAELSGLSANTLYHYQVTSGSGTSPVRTFRTHSTSDVFKFATNGHINALTGVKPNQAWGIITQYNPDFFFLTGDIAGLAANTQYRQLMTKGSTLVATKPFYTITGNHDTRDDSRYVNWFYNEFNNPSGDETYYVLHLRNIRFIFIRGSEPGAQTIQESSFPKTWLTGVLSTPTSADWTILVHDGNLYDTGTPSTTSGFEPWFETLIAPYLDIIDASISPSGTSFPTMPNGIPAFGAFNEHVALWEVSNTSITVKRAFETLGNIVFTKSITTDPGIPGVPEGYDGFGSASIGGGAETSTITVTSLADSGAGTLRAAFASAESATDQSTNCTTTGIKIDFSVSGTITLSSLLRMRFAGCVTVDGGGDIVISGQEMEFRDAANIIVTGLRFRNSGSGFDGLRFRNVDLGVIANNTCFDAGDECITVVDGSSNISVLDNLIVGGPTGLQRGSIILQFPDPAPAVENVTWARNLCVDNLQRCPEVSTNGRVDLINNLIAEWGRGTESGDGTRLNAGSGNILNNVYWKFSAGHDNDDLSISGGNWFIDGNLSVGTNPVDVDALSTAGSAFSGGDYTPIASSDVACSVGATVGARPLDSTDAMIVAEFTDGCGPVEPPPVDDPCNSEG